jgi:hypothetical protein
MLRPETVAGKLGWIHPAAIRGPAFRVLDRLQYLDPAVQVTATAVALCAMAQALGLDMRRVIEIAENTLRDSEGPYTTHIQAIRDYARGELLNR